MRLFFTSLATLLLLWCNAQQITPFPNRYQPQPGQLAVPAKLTISAAEKELAALIPVFARSAKDFYGITVNEKSRNGFIRLVRTKQISGAEAYKLTIGKNGVVVEGGSDQGCFYGLQSLLQLLNEAQPGGTLNCAVIEDQPRFGWRGVMLDESRHFFGKEQVKQILDLMALQKLNKFHWHLTDVPGWRIEIKQYPRLTTTGGIGNHTDPAAPARFYTQEEIAEIVEYACQRFIEVIPEIDMPGHATAAVKAYPEFNGGGSERYPDFTFNPGKEGTYTFLTNILREVTGLFPSDYIHIGGDEVHFGNEHWSALPEVQQLMNSQKLKNLVEVEHYFLNRMADSIQTIGKKVVGWDEVVTAGLPNTNTLVMWWRHDQKPLLNKAIAQHYEVVLCPRIPLYFDFVQSKTHTHGRKWQGSYAPIEAVYDFPDNYFSDGISVTDSLVKGIQANVWSETIHTPERLQFMLYPRLSALAEAAWTESHAKNRERFLERMNSMLELYQQKGINFFDYRNPDSPEIFGPEK